MLILVPSFTIPLLPRDLRVSIAGLFEGIGALGLLGGGIVILVVADVALLLAASRRFRRSRLVLD